MSDEADLSQERTEREEELRRRAYKPPALEVEATGNCLNCGEPLSAGQRWCDQDCQHDWQLRKK
jgi:hypothetical protein